MKFGPHYFYHEGEVYRLIKPNKNYYKLKTNTGEYKWISKKRLEEIVNKKIKTRQKEQNNI